MRMTFFEDFIGFESTNWVGIFQILTGGTDGAVFLDRDIKYGGGVARFRAADTLGQQFGKAIAKLPVPRFSAGLYPRLGMRGVHYIVTDQMQVWFGFFSYPLPQNNPWEISDFVGFRFNSFGTSNARWECVHKVGGSEQIVLTDRYGDPATFHDFEFALEPTTVSYLIDGEVVGSMVRSAPSVDLQATLYVIAPSGVDRSYRVDYIYGDQER